jgi:hypothetical protein
MRSLLVLLVLGVATGAAAEERILLVGDSHVTSTFGKALDLLLRTRDGAEVTTVGSCGVTPNAFTEGKTSKCGILTIERDEPDWKVHARRGTQTPEIAQLLHDKRPTLTIVELGANQLHLAYKDPSGAITEARTLAEQIVSSGSKCMWVGPPAGRGAQKPHHKMHFLYWVLEEAVGDLCHFTDSRPSELKFLDYERVTKQRRRKGDGRHFDAIGVVGQEMARRWALTVFEEASLYLDRVSEEEAAELEELTPESCVEVRESATQRINASRFAAR